MIDRGGSSNKKIGGGTFLSVPVNTLSQENIKRKARRDKRAADARAAKVNAGIEEQNRRLYNALAYQGRAEDLYASTGARGRDSLILQNPIPARDTSSFTPDGRYKYNFSTAGGQYQVAKTAVDYWEESTRPQNEIDYAKNAAKADTATEADVYSYYNDRRINQELHDEIIKTGNEWMVDEKAYRDWVLSAPTPEESNRRMEQAKKYFSSALHSVPTYDPNTHSYTTQMQFKADAPLPPWIDATTDHLITWRYYTTYSHDVVQASVDAYRHALDQGREYARNPHKSAFAGAEQGGQIDSFLDVVIASDLFKGDGFDAAYERLLNNTIAYGRDYIVNPIKAGELKTAAGNALWNMMDTMDVASRGVRALVAGDTVLGGSGGKEFERANSKFDDYYASTWEKYGLAPSEEYERNKNHGEWKRINDAKFKGQNVYWAHIDGYDLNDEDDLAKIQRAQTLFMENGGQELLLGVHQGEATKAQLGSGQVVIDSQERAKIARHLDELFEDSDIDWRDIYEDINENYYTKKDKRDFKQGLENVKKAYTDVDANFNADTGSLASDIIIETVLDPGILAGGIAKNFTKKGVESAAETAVKRGLKNIHLDEETATRIINNKQVRGAFNQLISSNEGKNIIFRSAKDFEDDVDSFILKLKDAKIFSNDETAKVFKDTVTSELMNKNLSVNGAIISTQKFARDALDSKAFKSMYYLDKAIDKVDSAIIKSSFFLPWAGMKGSKALYDTTVNLAAKSELIQKAAARLGMRKAQTLRRLIEDTTGEINVTKISDLVQQADSGMHHEKDVRTALQLVVDKYDDVTWSVNDIIRKFSSGEITDEEAFRQVGDLVRNATGGQYQYVQELSGYIDTITHRYAGDIRSAYGRLTDTFKRLQDVVDRRSESAVDGFIDKVRQAKDIDELKVLFREHMDNSFIMGLRERVLDNTQFELSMDELNKLVDDVQTGRFADQSMDRDMLKTGIAAQSKLSDRTLKRTIDFETMEDMLHRVGVDWKRVAMEMDNPDSSFSVFEKKITDFMKSWSGQKYVTYNTDDMLKFIDRFQRQVQFGELMRSNVPSEVSALSAHDVASQFNKLRKQIKRLDLVNLKDVKMIILPQVDRMAMNIEFRNSKGIQAMYGAFYDDVIDPIWKQFRNMTSDEIDLVDSSLFKDIDDIARQKYGFDRTSQLVEEVKALPGFSDDHLHSFLNTLATDFRFRDDMGNIDLTPGGLRSKLEANLRAQTGDSKVGRKQMSDSLQSLSAASDSSGYGEVPAFLKPYSDEILSKPALKARLDRYIQKDVLDPTSYVETQMMFTALADPSVIPEWNALAAKGQAPIAMHINTTGLNSEINSITSVSFRKWVPIDISDDNPLTLERLLDAMDSGETTVIQRRMNDNEFGELTEQVIRKLDMKDCSVENITKRYREIYGIPEGGTYKSERQMLEEVCTYLNDSTIIKDGDEGLRSVAPTLLVHDLDGFNIDYLNNKIMSTYDRFDTESKMYDYMHRVAKSAKDNSYNTYTRLAEQVGDLYYTDEQIDMITDIVHKYVDDINHFAQGYRFNDMQSYSRRIHRMIDELKLKEEAKQLTDREKQLLDSFRNADGEAALKAYDDAVKNIADLGLYPRQFAFLLSSDVDENFTKAAMDAVGRAAVNTKSRIYVDDILSYFNLETEDGFFAPLEDLRKMNEVSQYIIRTRNRQMVAGAEEFLLPHKADFDRMIQSVIDLANNNSYEATKLSYLQNMRIPDNAIDSYLMAKKLYADHLKYWLDTDNVSSLRSGSKDLDGLKQELRKKGRELGFDSPEYELDKARLFSSACDYVNDNRVRFFDELVGGGFDEARYDEIGALIDQFELERQEFWQGVSDDMKQVWGDFKERNVTRWDTVSKNAKENWQSFKDTNSDRWTQIAENAKARAKEFKETNKQAKQDMLSTNKADYEGYRIFKKFLDDLFNPAFDSIEEGFKHFRQAKEEKWDYFFGIVKPERDYYDDLLNEIDLDNEALIAEVKAQRDAINAEWQAYNRSYMETWFTNVSRDRVYEDFYFKDPALQEEYNMLSKQEASLRALSKERGENYAIAAQMIRTEMSELARKADNYDNLKSWLEWHGDHVLSDLEAQLKKEYYAARHGTLDPEHSILFGDNPEVKETYRKFIDDGFGLDSVKERTERRYVDYRIDLEERFNERYHITPEGKVVSQDLEGELAFRDAMLDTEEAYNRVLEENDTAYKLALEETEEEYEMTQLESALRYREADIAYDNLAIKQAEETYSRLDALDFKMRNSSADDLGAEFNKSKRGLKTTRRRINKSVRDTLRGTSLNAAERRAAVEKMDDAAKRASAAMQAGDESKAANIIYDTADELTRNMQIRDAEAYKDSLDLRRYLRTTPISIDSVKNDITDFEYFRKKHFGIYKFTKDGRDYSDVVDEIIKDFPGHFKDYVEEKGASGFFDYIDEKLANAEPKLIDFPDEEKAYFRDKLANEIYDIIHNRPNYDIIDVQKNFDNIYNTSNDVLDLLQGAHEPEIYNWAARSDFEKQVLHYRDDVMKSGLDKATHYMEAGSQVTSEMRQLQHMDEYFVTAGITHRQDRMLASVYTKTKQLFDILGGTDFLKRDSFHDFLQRASRFNRLHLQQYRLNSLRNADGVFDRTKLLSELVHNGFNMTVFNSYNYTPNEMRELKEFVERIQKSGDDFLSLYEDHTTGNVFVYLNDNCIVSEADGSRWINNSIRLDRPKHEVIPFAEFDELAELMDIPDIEDFRGVYAHLRSCWEDTRILSLGQINGTTGKTVSRSQAESFLQSLPSNMNNWLTSEGLLRDEMTRGVVYDPGFVLNEESDMLTDFLGTLHRQAEVAKDDAILINEVFHSTGSVQFSELAQNFSTEELIEYFGENPEYVVCTIVGDSKTASGFRVQQLNLNNALGVENARQMQNTTILPYAAYYDIANYMNRDVSDNIYKQLLGKYMLVYKAFALVKPGTWMRNFIDATAKAAFDNGEGLSGLGNMIQYEAKAARDIGTFGRIMATDPKLLNAANWDIIQSAYKTDMTFEDFELLRGVMDGNRFKSADRYFLSRTTEARGGARIISGENIGLRNLEEKDIREAVKKYLSGDSDLPLSEKEFLDIYLGNVKPDEDTAELYEEMFMKLSNNLRTSNVGTVFDKTIDTMFKPFGQVETLVRYAQTLQLRDNGFSQNQIVRHIHNTQFYNAPTWGKWRQLETIMPFITFKYNNMMYWVRMMDENPRLFRYFEDTYRSVYETTLESALEEGVELDYEDDYGLQSGGIPIGNGKAYFNMGNSFLSAMNDFYNIPHDIDSLNPLLRDTVRSSLYVLGLNSKQFFKDVDLELTDDEVIEHTKELFPGYGLFRDSTKAFKDIHAMCNASEGPSMDALYKTMKVFGVMGIRYSYQQKNGSFSLEEYQEELAKQGQWFDANLGKVVPLSEKNEFGANDPNNSWADIQTYMLTHFGKLWDANQRKFVTMDNYQAGGYNDGFDFENDPDAWDKLCEYMKQQGKRWDNNQRKFVSFPEDYIFGGLNSNTLDWDTKVTLMEERFGLVWDANQQAFVDPKYYISGGMNDFSKYSGDEFLSHWNELKSLRLALYGEDYDPETKKFVKVGEPSIVLSDQFMTERERKQYDNYYALLAIPRLKDAGGDLHMTDEGLLVNSKGQYVLTGNPEHDSKVFDKFRHTISYGGRSYNGQKNYSYNKTRKSNKPYHGRTMSRTFIQNYVDNRGYRFREEIKYNYQYTSPNPGGKLNYLIYPPRHYPYGGGYHKFSFNSRY